MRKDGAGRRYALASNCHLTCWVISIPQDPCGGDPARGRSLGVGIYSTIETQLLGFLSPPFSFRTAGLLPRRAGVPAADESR